jgi:pyrimidine operon attenuation protein/uracil phosphoribosyltransferase
MDTTPLLNEQEIAHTLSELAARILERHDKNGLVMLVGIQRRGADIAGRLARLIETRTGRLPALGTLDINLYRDDWTSVEGKPHIGQSSIPGNVADKVIILVDDVLFSGRTARAALEALLDYGRPKAVELLVLIDRGHRELPIQADYVGRAVSTSLSEHVDVLLNERDGKDAVLVSRA